MSFNQSCRQGARGGDVQWKEKKKPPQNSSASKRDRVDDVVHEDEALRGILQPICKVCGKACRGYYGRRGDSGTCNSDCEKEEIERQRSGRVQ